MRKAKIEPFPGVLTTTKVEHRFTTKTGRQGCQRVDTIVLTDEQKDWLRRWYPQEENPVIMAASGLKETTLHRFAREMGLTKTERAMKKIRRRTSARCVKTCTKNGYYASLKNRVPSEATRLGAIKMWQEIREGKREAPMLIIKRKDPKRYSQMHQRKGERRREDIKKEKQRIIYGLERKTKLNIVMCPYTTSQVSHRYYALKRGYIIIDDTSEQGGERYNIYYDDNTTRSEKFENNLIADGFKVLEWKE